MTPQPHCNHECVCYYVEPSIENDGESPCRITCEHDTRSRPAPPALERCSFWKNGVCNASWGLIEEEAMKAGAKSERARILKIVSDGLLNHERYRHNNLVYLEVPLKFVESLRSEQEKEAQDDRL